MDFKSFVGLDRDTALKEAAKIAGVEPGVFDGIWRTESGRGKHMLSPAGAEGHFGLMPTTRKVMEGRFGAKIDPYDFNQSLFTSAHLMKENLGKFGNLPDALRAYNGGWNPKTWGNPETSAYAGKVLRDLGGDTGLLPRGVAVEDEDEEDDGDTAPSGYTPRTLSGFDVVDQNIPYVSKPTFPPPGSLGGGGGKVPLTPHEKASKFGHPELDAGTFNANKAALVHADSVQGQGWRPTTDTAAPTYRGATEQEAAQEAEADALSKRTFIDLVMGRSDRSPTQALGQAIGMRMANRNEPVEPPTLDELKDVAEDDLPRILVGRSRAMRQILKDELVAERQQDAEDAKMGGLTGFLADVAIEGTDPMNLLAGYGVARRFALAGRAAHQQSSVTRAALAGATENVIGNVAVEGAVQLAKGYSNPVDLAGAAVVGAGLGTLGGGFVGALTKRQARLLEAQAADLEARLTKAAEDLGPDAAPEQVHAAVNEQIAREVQGKATLNEAAIPEGRRLFSEDPTGEDALKAHEDSAALLPQRAPRSDVDNHDTLGERPDVDKMDFPSLMSESELNTLETLPARNGFHDGGTGLGEVIEPRGTRSADSPEGFLADLRAAEARGLENQNGSHQRITERTGFDSYDSLMKMGQRVIASRMLDPGQVKTVDKVRRLIEKYMPEDHRIVFTSRMDPGKELGWAHSVGKAHIIALRDTNTPEQSLNTAIHEIGHLVVNAHIGDAPVAVRNAIMKDWLDFLGKAEKKMPEAWQQRLSITSATGTPEQAARAAAGAPISTRNVYAMKQDEYLAEQFVKHVQKMLAANKYGEGITADLKKAIMDMVHAALSFFRDMNRIKLAHGLMKVDEGAHDFFKSIFEGKLREDVKAKREAAAQRQASEDYGLDRSAPLGGEEDPDAANKAAFRADPDVRRFGLDTLPLETPAQRAEAKAVLGLWRKASDQSAAWNTMDEGALKSLLETGPFKLGSAALNMLRSKSPILRMAASELIENPNGAAGRRSTASISKFLNERKYMGSTLPKYDMAYQQWSHENGGGLWNDVSTGDVRARFDKEVAREIENRRMGNVGTPDARIKAAADTIQEAYERMRVDQIAKKVRGYKALPTTSEGYMPHRVSPAKMQNLSIDQQRALIDVIRDQVMGMEGWDQTFSEEFARKYLDAARRKATGGFDTNFNLSQPGAVDMAAQVIQSLGLTKEEARSMANRVASGRLGHTRNRTQLDLTQEFTDASGNTFTLLDVFDTDQLSLLRSQAARVSGEVALSDFGIAGKEGLDLIRRASEFGELGDRPQGRELEFFDQVAAEMLGQPFGEIKTKLADRTIMMTTLARLGGMGFQQIAETVNGLATVGATATVRALSSIGRLRAEAKALARGEQVNNPFLHSIEQFGGADFGADHYKLKFPFDNPTLEHQVYGHDTLTVGDRLLRGGMHAQAKLSFWRSIHAAQTRGFAEQIVLKSARYVAEGKNDTALRDIGLDDAWMAAARPHWGKVAQFDAHGNVTGFDISQLPTDLATTYTQAVWRGAAQIIQDTFVGERGAWAHGNWVRVLTQFRTFGLTSVEKQWGRQRNARGTAAALGILLGSMSLAAPIYTARVYAASLGRNDREQYLDKMLTPSRIARATLNMVSISGLAGDFIDATTAISGFGSTGGRTGAGKDFLGEIIAPGAGYVNDAFKAVQDTKKGTDIKPLLKVLPFSNLPYLVPAINALGK